MSGPPQPPRRRAPEAAGTGTRLAWLDVLRGLAALAVVFDHISYYVLQHVRHIVYQWFDPGNYGVFVFFIISGYIVPASLERKGSVRTFWVSRLFRLYPLYLLAVGIAVALYFAHFGSIRGEASDPATSVLSQLLMMSNVLGGKNLPNVVWSLSYEMVFYLLLTALFIARVHKRSSWYALGFAAAAVAVTPWAVRNRVQLGCFALTTDGRALWKANNLQTYDLLAAGKWIDDVKDPPGHPFPNPEEARDIYRQSGRKIHVDECANQSYYQHKAWLFVRDHPGAKAKLAGQAVRMEWDPRTTSSATDSGSGVIRGVAQPLYTGVLFALALVGLVVGPRRFVGLTVAVLAYQTLAAIVFVGATRYRVGTDFLLALLAAAALDWVVRRRHAAR